MGTRGPRIQPVGARSRATGVARLKKMNTDPAGITKSDYRSRKDGFESCDAGLAGARPYRRKSASRRIDSHTQEKAAHPISSTRKNLSKANQGP
jgi:hypothetical protein